MLGQAIMPSGDDFAETLRVAVVQIDYHPAFVFKGRSLIAEPLGTATGDALLPQAVFESKRRFSAPVRLDTAHFQPLSECELIVGPTELLIVAFLKLLGPLRNALRRQRATMLVHTGHYRELLQEAAELRRRTDAAIACDLTESVCSFVALGEREGCVRLVEWTEAHQGLSEERPLVPPLGDLELPDVVMREPLAESVDFAAAVLAKPNRGRVNADLFEVGACRIHTWSES